MGLTARDFGEPGDLRLMQALVAEAWALEGPKVERHIGDLAWGTASIAGREREWRRRLWLDGEDVVAFGWVFERTTLDFQLHPRRRELADEVLAWAGDCVTSALEDDEATLAALERNGYRPVGSEAWFDYLLRDLDRLPDPRVPEGFALRSVRDGDVEHRTAVHRAAWEPSRVTVRSMANVMRTWPYRPELDCVVEAPDGSFAASCLVWLDERNGVGELEPVGTDPRFRRLGLAAAVCTFALHRLREQGATAAIVYARGDPGYPAPKPLYESIGFRRHTRTIELGH